jgi:hypothetical protein
LKIKRVYCRPCHAIVEPLDLDMEPVPENVEMVVGGRCPDAEEASS